MKPLDKKQIRDFNRLVDKEVAKRLQKIADELPTSYMGFEGATRNLINREIKRILYEAIR